MNDYFFTSAPQLKRDPLGAVPSSRKRVYVPVTNPTFSKKVGCLHSIVIAAVFAGTSGIAALAFALDTGTAGDLVGRLFWVVAFLGFFASYLYQRGRRLLAGGTAVVLWAALPAFFFNVARRTRVTDAEKRHLQVSADRIRHPDFGFVLPHPGKDFHLLAEPPPEMLRMLASRREGRRMFLWVLRNEASSEVLMVSVYKARVRDERDFRKYAAAARATVARVKGAEVLQDTLVWEPGVHELRFGVRIGTDIYGKWRCLASRSARAVLVCAQTWAPEPDGLDFVRAGLALEGPAP